MYGVGVCQGVGTLHQLDEELLVGNRQSTTAPRRKGVATQGQDLLGLSAHVDESREASVPVDFIHRKVRCAQDARNLCWGLYPTAFECGGLSPLTHAWRLCGAQTVRSAVWLERG